MCEAWWLIQNNSALRWQVKLTCLLIHWLVQVFTEQSTSDQPLACLFPTCLLRIVFPSLSLSLSLSTLSVCLCLFPLCVCVCVCVCMCVCVCVCVFLSPSPLFLSLSTLCLSVCLSLSLSLRACAVCLFFLCCCFVCYWLFSLVEQPNSPVQLEISNHHHGMIEATFRRSMLTTEKNNAKRVKLHGIKNS